MSHEIFMRFALESVKESPSFVSPNPRVGCVIVKDGQIIGQGSTRPPGGNHAEIEALEDALRKGKDVKGAAVYVTLEPCSHHGRTGPCADALIKAGVSTVIAAMTDPDPRVSGKGFSRLKAAGIEVVSGVLEEDARELNLGFLSRVERKRPWVRMKIASSLDGKTALKNGKSQWITSADARKDGHFWRAQSDAVLTGIGTVLHDDPQLTVRAIEVVSQPRRIILDSHLRILPTAKVLENGNAWIFCVNAETQKVRELEDKGAEVIVIPAENGKVDLKEMMRELAKREINEVHVEAGAILNGALIQAGCVDEVLLYMAPSFIGEGLDMCLLPALASLNDQVRFQFRDITRVGSDLRILARIA